MKKSIFYFTMLLALNFSACLPKATEEPAKLKIILNVTDCTGQLRYGAKVVSADGKYTATQENIAGVSEIETNAAAQTFTFRVKDERGNTLSYQDTTFSVTADDRSVILSFRVKCDGFIKGRILDRTGAPKIGYARFAGVNNFVAQDSNKTNFLLPIRYKTTLPTDPEFGVITKAHSVGDDGAGLFIPNIPFGDTLDLGDVYGEMVSNFSYTVNGDGFTNKSVVQLANDVCAESSGASTLSSSEFWLQMIDNAGCASNANNSLRLWLNTTPTAAGIYPLKGGEFAFQGSREIYTPDANMTFRITTLGARGRLIEGTFSGTASYKDTQNITHTITITNGVFKVLRKN
jgi:hypothetical protein